MTAIANEGDSALRGFHPVVQTWFTRKFGAPTAPQRDGWPAIASRTDTLIAAPTGSGKTLAAFLSCINDLIEQGLETPLEAQTEILYISPLKALGNDVHRNLQQPLSELAVVAEEMGVELPAITTAVRSGDTPMNERAKTARRPPHILITTPESLYILLTSKSGRAALESVRTVIIDEIHAVARDKRGSHLSLSVERLERLCTDKPVRIGLSATQRPIEDIARLLVGTGRPMPTIVDSGHQRELDIAIEVPRDELGPIASTEMSQEVYDRIAMLVKQHRTTLVFTNTRRMVERVSHALGERLGEDNVVAHHGSLSRRTRFAAEQKLKYGEVPCAVATASLELGIDVGVVDLVVQLGSPRSIATLLQRIGRSGHSLGATPKGRLFALTRDQLVECAALVRAIKRGNLDRVCMREAPLDILAQQVVAAAGCEDWDEDDLFAMVRGAYPYRDLPREKLDAVLDMLSEGVALKKGRSAAHLHRDRINQRIRGRRGARLAAMTSGGAIPDNANYTVVASPEETTVGTIDEDFAIESLPGDIFLLGNTSWRVKRVAQGKVLVEDAKGAAPNIPFWLGEAPARTPELCDEVSDLRGDIDARLADGMAREALVAWTAAETSMPIGGAEQMVEYLAAGRKSLGVIPTKRDIVAERFFDEAGGMQLVVHSPLGGRINKAWGLALRKKFCVNFNFELQAAATDDGIVISLGPMHSFPLDTVFQFVRARGVRDTLEQAALQAPMFGVRWRWNATRSLAILRRQGGKRVPPFLIRMKSDDLLAAVFPSQAACQDNVVPPIDIPSHPIIEETMRDCLTEVMDVPGFEALLVQLEAGNLRVHARDTAEPSQLSHEILNANPYAFLDDAPLEERRARAVTLRRSLGTDLDDIGALDADAIATVTEEAAPVVRSADELHDALLSLIALPPDPAYTAWFDELVADHRATTVRTPTPALPQGRVLQEWGRTPDPFARSLSKGRPRAVRQAHRERENVPHRERENVPHRERENVAHRERETVPHGERETVPHGERENVAHRERETVAHRERETVAHRERETVPHGEREEVAHRERETVAHRERETVAHRERETVAHGERENVAHGEREEVPHGEREKVPHGEREKVPSLLQPSRGGGAGGPVDLWVAAERVPTALAALPDATCHPTLPPLPFEVETPVREEAALAIVRGHVECCGPTTAAALSDRLGLTVAAVDEALLQLESEGAVLRGNFTRTDAGTVQWCDRRILARIHRVTLGRLRREIEPVTAADLMRFLFRWQKVAPGTRLHGAQGAGHVVEQLQGFEAAAGAWERDILPARIERYQPEWLDALCWSGEIVWGRLSKRKVIKRGQPTRAAPIAIALRDDLGWLRRAPMIIKGLGGPEREAEAAEPIELSLPARDVLDHLTERGASFAAEIQAAVSRVPTEVEEGLWELVTAGLATADGFASLRTLIDRKHRSPAARRRPGRHGRIRTAPTGRWSALAPPNSSIDDDAHPDDDVEACARQLLARYGVVFRDLLARETLLPPWRELLVALRRLEARGEIRGGRFVTGFVGEQYALPDAVDALRAVRRKPDEEEREPEYVRIAATDPLNLVGVTSPGPKVPAVLGNAVLFRDGVPVASVEAGELISRVPLDGWRVDRHLRVSRAH